MKFLFTSLVLILSACASKQKCCEPVLPAAAPSSSLEAAVANPARTPENRMRDTYRHPLDTLKFFGIQPQQTVVEISPSAGWYSEILAPYLNAQGQYVVAQVGESDKYGNDKRIAWMKAHAQDTDKTKTVDFAPPKEIGAANSADFVLTFRNVHNWMNAGGEKDAFKSFYKTLKPGGILGVVEHRAPAKQKKDPKAKSGYVREADVIAMARAAGFELVGQSEINANAKDLKNYPDGVWTLPPTLKLKDKDRDKYVAIGESDRMTLKFQKPATAK